MDLREIYYGIKHDVAVSLGRGPKPDAEGRIPAWDHKPTPHGVTRKSRQCPRWWRRIPPSPR